MRTPGDASDDTGRSSHREFASSAERAFVSYGQTRNEAIAPRLPMVEAYPRTPAPYRTSESVLRADDGRLRLRRAHLDEHALPNPVLQAPGRPTGDAVARRPIHLLRSRGERRLELGGALSVCPYGRDQRDVDPVVVGHRALERVPATEVRRDRLI